MEQKSMTALVSAFSRAYHSRENTEKIFDDYLAKDILTKDEYNQISENMSNGIKFFNPSFKGSREEGLRWIVDNQLSPTPLGRAAFAEKSLESAVKEGRTAQYLIFAAGYDTFAYRKEEWASQIEIFEIDHPSTAEDKQKRINLLGVEKPENLHYVCADFTKENWIDNLVLCENFDERKISFCSLLGITYYLSKEDFIKIINKISNIIPKGSCIAFDYPDETTHSAAADEQVKRQTAMAAGAKEKMLASYSYLEMEEILSRSGLSIKEHLTPKEITAQYFKKYNEANPAHPMKAFSSVNYCLAIKK